MTDAPCPDKPHKGTIDHWHKEEWPTIGGLGYVIVGRSAGHPQFDGRVIHTSYVVAKAGDEIETRNSRYTLGKPAVAA